MAIVKHLKFGSTTYDLPEGKNVLNLLCDTAPGADIGSFNVWVDVYEDQGQPSYTVQFGVYGNTTKTKIQTASSWGQNTDFDMNIEAVVNGIPCILVKYNEYTQTWSYRGSGHRFAYDINGGKLYEFDFELDLSIDLISGNYTGNLSGDFYSISNINEVSIGGSSSAAPGNCKVATVSQAPGGQIQSVVSTPQAGCVDSNGMNLGVSIDNNGQIETYLHSLGHNFENSSAPGVKWDSLAFMDYSGALQPYDNITLNLYFMTTPNSGVQKVIIPGTYDSQLGWGGYLYFLNAGQSQITQVQYVGA